MGNFSISYKRKPSKQPVAASTSEPLYNLKQFCARCTVFCAISYYIKKPPPNEAVCEKIQLLSMDHRNAAHQQAALVRLQLEAVSGQTQHTAGVIDSKTILCINNDADAPMFKLSDYGIVGDYKEVIPALVAAIKAKKDK